MDIQGSQVILEPHTDVDDEPNSTAGLAIAAMTGPSYAKALVGASPLISSLVPSTTSVFDGLKLAVLGAVMETLRRNFSTLWKYITDSLFFTAKIHQDDDSFEWLMFWLSDQAVLRTAQNVSIYTRLPSTVPDDLDPHTFIEPGSSCEGQQDKDIILQMVPSIAEVYTLWPKGCWLQVTRTVDRTTGSIIQSAEQTLSLKMMTWNRGMLSSLIREAKGLHDVGTDNSINIYIHDSNLFPSPWRRLATRPKRPIQSIILDHGIQRLLLEDARDFLRSKAWYTERGIPFRRGYLLHGVPGSGKTSLIHSIAGELDLNVYLIPLSQVGMDDTRLTQAIAGLPENCIALMEDIDVAFHRGISRDSDSGGADNKSDSSSSNVGANAPKEAGDKEKEKTTVESRVSLSGLLNALDGIGAQEGRILFATTNRYSALDPALRRPGRMDLHVEFHNASKSQAKALYSRFFKPTSVQKTTAVGYENANGDGFSLVASSNLVKNEANSSDSGYNSQPELDDNGSDGPPPAYFGVSHRERAPTLLPEQLDELATRFASSIPERKFSMAALQGYLMTYKVKPVQAVEDVAEWVVKELAEKKQDVTIS